MEAFNNGLRKDIDENIKALESEADRFANIFNGRIKRQIGRGVLDDAISNAVASAIEAFAEGI